MDIVFENANYIVANKPFGMPSVKDPSKRESLEEKLEKEIGVPLFPVHRLDAATGGLIVFAKNAESAKILSEEIVSGSFKKKYLAVCTGEIPDGGTFTDYLLRDAEKNTVKVVSKEKKDSKYAELKFRVLCRKPPFSLVEIELITGRTHQIRVQFSSRKIYIVGDEKYGGVKNKNLCLFSEKLDFTEPFTQKPVSFSAIPEKDLIWNIMIK